MVWSSIKRQACRGLTKLSTHDSYTVLQFVDDKLSHLASLPRPCPLLPRHQPVLVGPHGARWWRNDCTDGSRHSGTRGRGGEKGKRERGRGEEKGGRLRLHISG